jgi:hypothetical protein
MVRTQYGSVQFCHVDCDAAVYVREPSGGRMTLAFDCEVAALNRSNDRNGSGHILSGRGT